MQPQLWVLPVVSELCRTTHSFPQSHTQTHCMAFRPDGEIYCSWCRFAATNRPKRCPVKSTRGSAMAQPQLWVSPNVRESCRTMRSFPQSHTQIHRRLLFCPDGVTYGSGCSSLTSRRPKRCPVKSNCLCIFILLISSNGAGHSLGICPAGIFLAEGQTALWQNWFNLSVDNVFLNLCQSLFHMFVSKHTVASWICDVVFDRLIIR